jgi:hypothetical protein
VSQLSQRIGKYISKCFFIALILQWYNLSWKATYVLTFKFLYFGIILSKSVKVH